jgi:NADH-quinone oxidoreductase subunit H
MVVLFFGGWQLPILQWFGFDDGSIVVALFQILTTLAKVAILVFVIIWIRWSIPRFKYNQLMRLGWHILIPLSLLNLVITACILYFNIL